MNTKTAKTRILAGEFDAALSRLYGDARVPAQRIRYANAVASFEQLYGEREPLFNYDNLIKAIHIRQPHRPQQRQSDRSLRRH